jgi:hypothetical protein
VNTIENSVKTNEEIGSREKPDMMFDEYGWWVKLVGKGMMGSRIEVGGRNIISVKVHSHLNERRKKKWWHNKVVQLLFK